MGIHVKADNGDGDGDGSAMFLTNSQSSNILHLLKQNS